MDTTMFQIYFIELSINVKIKMYTFTCLRMYIFGLAFIIYTLFIEYFPSDWNTFIAHRTLAFRNSFMYILTDNLHI